MKHAISVLGASLLMFAISVPVSAATGGCLFKKSLQKSGVTFDVSSRPAIGCAVQVIHISVRRGGKNFSRLSADVDYQAEDAWAADLSGDGKPELVIASRSAGSEARGVLDVYSLEGNSIRRASVPQLHGQAGYRGGDRFRLDGRQIVRTVPVYHDGDAAGNPTGGSRTLKYEFSDWKISLLENNVTAAQALNDTDIGRAVAKTVPAGALKPVIRDITVTESSIEITGDVPLIKFKTMKLDKPERIAIDIPGSSSPLAGKRIKIEKYGISRARVGLNRGFLRIVLDSTLATFPKFTITTFDSGLRIVFGGE